MRQVTDQAWQERSTGRAAELFQQHRHEIFESTDRLLGRFMVIQWLAGILFALLVSPHTWVARASQVHLHVWAAIFVGGAISAFPIWMTRVWPGAVATRYVVGSAQMLMSSLLVCLTGGRIETHFHFFASLVILSFYRDWKVFVPATLVIGLSHFVQGIFWPLSVYGVLTASPWRSVEHAAWVVFEEVFLIMACLRSIREMRSIANRTAALEMSEQSSRQTFEGAPIGMAIIGLDEHFQKANTAFCEMTGYCEEELRRVTPIDITFEDDRAESRLAAQVMRDAEKHTSVEKRYVRKGGEVLWVRRTGCIVRDSLGAPRHYLIMVEDITRRKKADVALEKAKDEADRANKAKSEFLSRMSHELRTPLNAIIGFGQLLERHGPTEKQRSHLRHITGAGRHLLDLINEVLDISRIEAGRLQLSLEPVSVSEAVQEALDLVRPLAAERGTEIAVESSLEPACFVLADKQRFKQVALNLFTNALKYTPAGGQVTISYDLSKRDRVVLVVSDTGAGIPPDKLRLLFMPFERLGAENSEVQGTGLGLAVCHRLMGAMGGTIGVHSEPGVGSRFWIEFPRATRASAKPARNKELGLPRLETAEGVRIVLYIEDNRSNVSLVEEILADQPETDLVVAWNGKEGIELARERRPDAILLDLNLPDLPGQEVLRRLKSDRTTREIPVVVLSADATTGQRDRLGKTGAYAYLTKPLDVDGFLLTLKEAVDSSKTHAELVLA